MLTLFLSSLQRVLHAILTTRALLNLREARLHHDRDMAVSCLVQMDILVTRDLVDPEFVVRVL